jgi:hypothetical protein
MLAVVVAGQLVEEQPVQVEPVEGVTALQTQVEALGQMEQQIPEVVVAAGQQMGEGHLIQEMAEAVAAV